MRSISYPARDGTRIPGYRGTPRGASTSHLPLIVMPHGGPIARDTWAISFCASSCSAADMRCCR